MKHVRLFGLIVGAALVLGLIGTGAAASAADPEFKPSTKQTFKSTSGSGVLESAAGSKITCTANSGTGEITGASKVGKVVVTFTGCTGKKSAESEACSANSTGAAAGSIVTKTLDGELGLTKQATSGVGLVLLPETTKNFVTIEAPCLEPATTAVEGSIAGEASPIAVSSTTGKLGFTGSGGKQNITEIGVLGATVKLKLTAFGAVAASWGMVWAIVWSLTVEVV